MKKCEYCGKEFEPKRATARFCSTNCRVKASNEDTNEPRPDLRELKKKRDAMNPATGEVIPDTIMEATKKRREKMNAIFAAEGLPLIQTGPLKEYFVDSGISEINELTRIHDANGIGGFPRQKITEIFGTAGSAKSSLVKSIVANPNTRVLYIDVEGGLTSPPENVDVLRASLVEEVEKIIIRALEAGSHDIILVDSVAPLVTKQRFEQDLEGLGSKAKAMSRMINSVMARLRPQSNGLPSDSKGTAMVFINQLRDTLNSFGKREFTPGGRSIEFMASLRLEFRSSQADVIKRKEGVVGQWVRVKVIKTRFGIRNQETRYQLLYKTLDDFDAYYQERIKELL